MKRTPKVIHAFKTKWDELSHLADNGMLKPARVVAFAQNENTHLHKCFEWDDGKAAANYRIQQARQQISMYIMVVQSPKGPVKIRAFQSLPSDRLSGGGYRKTTDIMQNEALVAELVASAMSDLATVRQRYEAVAALSPVWEAAEQVAKAHAPALKKAA